MMNICAPQRQPTPCLMTRCQQNTSTTQCSLYCFSPTQCFLKFAPRFPNSESPNHLAIISLRCYLLGAPFHYFNTHSEEHLFRNVFLYFVCSCLMNRLCRSTVASEKLPRQHGGVDSRLLYYTTKKKFSLEFRYVSKVVFSRCGTCGLRLLFLCFVD